MTATNQIIKVRRGNTAALSVALTQADGTPYDPTIGAVVRWRMARNWHNADILVLKTLGNGLEWPAAGEVNITLDATDTDFSPGLYHHELTVWDGGDVNSAMIGTVVIKPAMPFGEAPIGIQSPGGAIQLSATVPTVL